MKYSQITILLCCITIMYMVSKSYHTGYWNQEMYDIAERYDEQTEPILDSLQKDNIKIDKLPDSIKSIPTLTEQYSRNLALYRAILDTSTWMWQAVTLEPKKQK